MPCNDGWALDALRMSAKLLKPPAAVMREIERRQRRDVDLQRGRERYRQGMRQSGAHHRCVADDQGRWNAADTAIHPCTDAPQKMHHRFAAGHRPRRIGEPFAKSIGARALYVGNRSASPFAIVEVCERRLDPGFEAERTGRFNRRSRRARDDDIRMR